MTFTHYSDPGHGWIEVHDKDLAELGLTFQDFTTHSYRDGSRRLNYLEEDCDAAKFVATFTKKHGRAPVIKGQYRQNCFIRNLPKNKGGQWRPFGG